MDSQVPSLVVKIDGKDEMATDSGGSIAARTAEGVLSAMVDLRLDSPDMFTVEYDMMALEKLDLVDAFKPGAPVEISFGFDAQEVLCVGEIAYIEPSFDVDVGYRTTISGYHKLHRLTRGQRSKTWGEGIEDSESSPNTAQQVLADSKANVGGGEDGLSADEMGQADVKHRYIPQLNASDFEFLTALGAELEYKADSESADKVKFIQPDPSSAPVVTLQRERGEGENAALILNASFRLSTVQQYAKVEVRSWDPWQKKNIVGVCESSNYSFGGTDGKSETGTALYGSAGAGRKYVVVDQPVNTKEEADALAQAIFDQYSMDFVTGEVAIEGNTKVVPGVTVEFEGFGTVFSGTYLVTSATHSYRPEEGYRTMISFARNAHSS
jgi:uncharacterized protein